MKIIPFLKTIGSIEHPRFIVTETLGKFWTGTTWSEDESDVLVFAEALAATTEVQKILQEEYKDAIRTDTYVVPLLIEVRSTQPLDPEDLYSWLRQATDLRIAYGNYGNGPSEDSLVQITIDWTKFRPEEKRDNQGL